MNLHLTLTDQLRSEGVCLISIVVPVWTQIDCGAAFHTVMCSTLPCYGLSLTLCVRLPM